jgi:hypothetical protein
MAPAPIVPLKQTGTDKESLQRDFTRYVAKATKVIFSPETRDQVLEMLKTGVDPVQSTANVAVMVMQRVDSAIRSAGQELQDSVRIFAGHEVIKSIAEYAEAAKLFKLNEELQLLATSVAAQDYIKAETKAGRINPKALQVQIQADLRKLPPKERTEILAGAKKTQDIAKRYNQGKGSISTAVGQPDKKKGMIAAGGA